MDEQIHGLTLRDCAEIMHEDGKLKVDHGEAKYKPYLHQFLASRGTDESTWANAWNGWWKRMESDPSGQLHAKFAMLQQEMHSRLQGGPDMSQESKEGVTMDVFAQVSARAAGGEDIQAVVAEVGLDWPTWQKGSGAWNAAMGADTTGAIAIQYGQLYAKHNPAHQAQMQGQIAGMMAAHHAERQAGPADDEPEEEYEFPHMVADMESPTPVKRWDGAHHIFNRWDIAGEDARRAPEMEAAAQRAVVLMNECLERHDSQTIGNAESAAKDLSEFASEGFLTAEQADEARGNIARCLNRAREEIVTTQAAFDSVTNHQTAERTQLRMQIQEYESLIEELTEIESEWDDKFTPRGAGGAVASAVSASAPSSPSASLSVPDAGGGLLWTLKRLPIIGPILRLLGL